jgi:DNA-binding SARP family transcriptional activator/tetratricopeptide (TPR) repeat protein
MTAAERLTLLSKPSRTSLGLPRYHPLVREFLEARLRSTFGREAVALLHRRAAEAAVATDWKVAAYHFRESGDPSSVATTIAEAIPEIMGSGQHAAAVEEIDRLPPVGRLPALSLVKSRIELQRRDFDSAIALSRDVLDGVEPGSDESDYALLNLVTLYFQTTKWQQSREMVERLRDSTSNEDLRLIADGTGLLIEANNGGSIDVLTQHLTSMAERQKGVHPHFYGVTKLNLAVNAVTQDQPIQAVAHARDAIEALEGTSSRIELAAAFSALAYPLTLLGEFEQAQSAINRALELDEAEPNLELADLADSYTDPDAAERVLDSLRVNRDATAALLFAVQSAWFFVRRRRYDDASAIYSASGQFEGVFLSRESTRRCTAAYIAVASGRDEGRSLAIAAKECATNQQATRWLRIADLLVAFCGSSAEFGSAIKAIGSTTPWNVTHVADLVCRRLEDLDHSAISVVTEVAHLHPGRWRFVLRDHLASARVGEGLEAARLLEPIGDLSDIQRLRDFAKRQRRLPGTAMLGRKLARRLAERVVVEDQNRLSIHAGDRHIQGSTIRRKVLALLCFLLTKPDMSSTRDQVLDALWPDLDPPDALNSLNQTVYFLRRVIEENYVDDLSPGYLHHDSDLIWLDSELVTSRSNDCRRLIKSFPPAASPDQVNTLVDAYKGRFALDFEYEEWAAPYRDWLHASYLEIVERALNDDIETGHFDRGISLARRVLDVDPTAEHVEVSLLRLYRASGAHAAAAEQYSHYASAVREQLGVEPPPLESL